MGKSEASLRITKSKIASQRPYQLQKIKKPSLASSLLEASRQLLDGASPHRRCYVLFCLVLGGYVVSKLVIPPESESNQLGRYHVSPQSAKRSINFC